MQACLGGNRLRTHPRAFNTSHEDLHFRHRPPPRRRRINAAFGRDRHRCIQPLVLGECPLR
ncbi:hypothetical protein PSMK_19960 [Phycisphaera mikurensis NBRC 102666]|uniref:Uncharacterized protein n=1 Tax=Phycisphaera mikurensis (strain NBRC 102666 / KCTC 22515 / FYK2301M01) TaxID=1142394 RepID=I0IFW7_PHYMF|nr:hypothetical protein PSMK_19960 [Phycisphaera mikurensis NBRC 102666]